MPGTQTSRRASGVAIAQGVIEALDLCLQQRVLRVLQLGMQPR